MNPYDKKSRLNRWLFYFLNYLRKVYIYEKLKSRIISKNYYNGHRFDCGRIHNGVPFWLAF